MPEPLMASISFVEWLRLDAVCKAAKRLVESVEPGSEPHTERVIEAALTTLETLLEAAGYGADSDREPPEDDGECFRGDEAAACLRDQQIEAQRIK